jgi:hypothetical protein
MQRVGDIGGTPVRYLNGIGWSLPDPPNLTVVDRSVHIVTDEEAFYECWRRSERGFHIGSSGAVLLQCENCKRVFSRDIVIGLLPDKGEIYDQTIYSPVWLSDTDLMSSG